MLNDLARAKRRRKEKKMYFVSKALMFGSTAAVYAFKMVSRSRWFLIGVYLKVPAAEYFDDYPIFLTRVQCPRNRHAGGLFSKPCGVVSR